MTTDDQKPAAMGPAPRPTWVKVLLVVLAVVFLAPGACGGVFYGAALWEWVANGFDFNTGRDNYTGVIAIFAVPCILASIFALGLLMRFVRIKAAPTISLGLAILAVVVVLLSYFVFRSVFAPMDVEDDIILFIVAVAALLVVGLPSLQHWWSETHNR